jgi:hypothetical protein
MEHFLNINIPPQVGESWTEQRLNIILILCGMYTKKELMRLQRQHFERHEGYAINAIINGSNIDLAKNLKVPILKE